MTSIRTSSCSSGLPCDTDIQTDILDEEEDEGVECGECTFNTTLLPVDRTERGKIVRFTDEHCDLVNNLYKTSFLLNNHDHTKTLV